MQQSTLKHGQQIGGTVRQCRRPGLPQLIAERKPQVTPTAVSPAFFAVCISTALSPMYSVVAGAPPSSRSSASVLVGSGLRGISGPLAVRDLHQIAEIMAD